VNRALTRVKKNRHRWRFLESCFGLFCCRVNLPLLHRLLAGMAKVKKAGKENCVAHAGSELVKRL
jgi:hypothetical protein